MKQKNLSSLFFLMCILTASLSNAQISGIEASYSFSGSANDDSGNGNNGQLMGNASVNGVLKVGNNTTSYLVLPPSVINGKTDFSITMKIKFKSFHKSGTFPTNHIITGSSTSLDKLGLSYERVNQTWRLALNGTSYSFPDLLFVNVWYCVTVTREINQAKLYVDGVLVGSATVNTTAIPCTSLLIGQEEDCSGGCFAKNQCTNGQIDDLKFIDHALTLEEAQSVCSHALTKIEEASTLPASVTFYPNPAHETITITQDASTIQHVEIYSAMGQKVATYSHSNSISIGNLSPGIYIIRVLGIDGEITAAVKFIKE